jgi:hypothetical protein
MIQRLAMSWRIAVLCLVVTGCTEPTERLLDTQLTSGGDLRAALKSKDTAVALLLDPAECSSCDPLLRRWLAAQARQPEKILLVLTRTPSEHERRDLILRRIRPAGVLPKDLQQDASYPRALVWIRGQATRFALLSEESTLLTAIE